MPRLSEIMKQPPEGMYGPAKPLLHARPLQTPIVPAQIVNSGLTPNQFLRCPMPPINSASPDSLRQFQAGIGLNRVFPVNAR